jgi:hypothetical protein
MKKGRILKHTSRNPTTTGVRQERVPHAGFFRKAIPNATHDAIRNTSRPPPPQKGWVKCPWCGHVQKDKGKTSHDPVTGYCKAEAACMKRRDELDEETIEFMGLVR